VKLIWAPGYAILYISYVFPKEWGKQRSVVQSGRQWKHRDTLAPIYSVIFYVLLLCLIISLIHLHYSEDSTSTSNSNVSNAITIPSSEQTALQNTPPIKVDDTSLREIKTVAQIESKQNGDDFEVSFSKFIDNLEIENNYSGNDQIIRCRLKIPQRKLTSVSQIEIWKSTENLLSKEEAIALILKEHCK
jgi:hypothetical protein